MNKLKKTCYMIMLISGLSSCATQNLFETDSYGNILELLSIDSSFQEPIVSGNKLSISIWSHEDMSIGSIYSMYESNEETGKWIIVNDNGEIGLPQIGDISLVGLTTTQASDTLEGFYSDILEDPVINVRVMNREVVVLGEVKTPGTYYMTEEYNTLADILGYAEGFGDYANLEEIQLLRDSTIYKIDLTVHTQELLHNIWIRSNDVVNVPARKGKMLDRRAGTLIPFATALSAVALITTLIVR